jgi:hypothetical protein
MRQWLKLFLEIALWRRGPQDLPASPALLGLLAFLYAVVDVIQLHIFRLEVRSLAAYLVVDLGILMAWLWFLLALFRKRDRFLQTASAVLGTSVLIGMLDVVMFAVQFMIDPRQPISEVWQLGRFILTAAIIGRILMIAIETGLFTGIGLMLAIALSTELAMHPILKESL